MDNSRVIEILSMVIDGLEDKELIDKEYEFLSGICGFISNLYYSDIITLKDRDLVKSIVMANKPDDKQFTEFTKGRYWTGNTFWWLPISREKNTLPVRVEFLKKLIIKLNKN